MTGGGQQRSESGKKKPACFVRCRKPNRNANEASRKSIRDASDRDGVNAMGGRQSAGWCVESGGFLEFEFGGVGEGVEDAEEAKLETRKQKAEKAKLEGRN